MSKDKIQNIEQKLKRQDQVEQGMMDGRYKQKIVQDKKKKQNKDKWKWNKNDGNEAN